MIFRCVKCGATAKTESTTACESVNEIAGICNACAAKRMLPDQTMTSGQTFEIVRAPEEPPLTAKELRHLLWTARSNSEWAVVEKTGPAETGP